MKGAPRAKHAMNEPIVILVDGPKKGRRITWAGELVMNTVLIKAENTVRRPKAKISYKRTPKNNKFFEDRHAMSFWRCSELASPAVSPGSAGSPLEVIIWGVLNGDRDGTCSPLTKESVAPRPHASSNFAAEGSSSGRMKSGTRGRRLRLKIHCRVRTPLMM